MNKLSQLHLHKSPLMPVIFVGHGNPLLTLTENTFSSQWRTVGSSLPDAQAVVVVSAHWMTRGTHITDAPSQPLIYDFYGFPDEMYTLEYPAQGSREVATELRSALLHYEAKLDATWGLDHGTWTVLRHLLPGPKIPVLQISIDMTKSLEDLYEIFGALRSFRRRGVVFIGSGNIVHNLRMVDFTGKQTHDWALDFDAASKDIIQSRKFDELVNPFRTHASAQLAIPTDDHYRPLVTSMALLDDSESVSFFNEAIDLGSVSMRSFISV